MVWAALGALAGLLIAPGIGSGSAPETALGAVLGAAIGAAFPSWLGQALPLFGVVLGPLVALTLMNTQRFLTTYAVATPSGARRGARTAAANPPTLAYVTTAIGVLASAVLAAILLHALSSKLRREHHELKPALKSVAWICFWITLAMILLSNFAPA